VRRVLSIKKKVVKIIVKDLIRLIALRIQESSKYFLVISWFLFIYLFIFYLNKVEIF